MANPGAPQGINTHMQGHHNYLPQTGGTPMNLAGPMPQMGTPNSSVSLSLSFSASQMN